MKNKAVLKATIFYEKGLWIGAFERTDKDGYAVARHIFGAEPTDPEIYEFVLTNFNSLKFGKPKEWSLKIKRMNPKRVLREARKEMERIKQTTKPCTYAQDYMRQEIEKGKIEKKSEKSEKKQIYKKKQFELKQQKKKRKKRGH